MHIGDRVHYHPVAQAGEPAAPGAKPKPPAPDPEPVVAMVTKLHGPVGNPSCINVVVIEDGDLAGQRFTSIALGGPGSGGYSLLPRTHYLPPV